MAGELRGKRFAIVATDGFEQSELLEPQKALKNAGAEAEIIAPKAGRIQGMQHHDKGQTVAVDHTIAEVKSDDYAGLVLPGGVANPDELRTDERVVRFVRDFIHGQEAGSCNLPCALDLDRGEGRRGSHGNLVAFPQDRSRECRRALGRSRGRHRQWAGD